jgi:hypothetical protein
MRNVLSLALVLTKVVLAGMRIALFRSRRQSCERKRERETGCVPPGCLQGHLYKIYINLVVAIAL